MCIRWLPFLLAAALPLRVAAEPTAASLFAQIQQLSVDEQSIYHVHDLYLAKGDAKFYLTDGYLMFARPVEGYRVAAAFTTAGLETGDAEVVVLPPSRGERASLAYFTKSPALNEHIRDALFFFADGTGEQLLSDIHQRAFDPVAAGTAGELAAKWSPSFRALHRDMETRLIASLLNQLPRADGIFLGVVGSERLGIFNVFFDPEDPENTLVGRPDSSVTGSGFEIWMSFASRRSPPQFRPFVPKDYRIDLTVDAGLHTSVRTRLTVVPAADGLRGMVFQLSPLMRVTAATVNGQEAEVFEQPNGRQARAGSTTYTFLVVSPQRLRAGQPAELEIRHDGSIIRDSGSGIFFVEARNLWYPAPPGTSAVVDMVFHKPPELQVVSSGRLLEATPEMVHRRLDSPAHFVGFNLGKFVSASATRNPFQVECFGNEALGSGLPDLKKALQDLAQRTGNLLATYTSWWGEPVTKNLAVTPIPATFGQGFSGLIYLPQVAYLPESARPDLLGNPLATAYFSDIVLAHEVAHQWWGNSVGPKDYRSDWLSEGLANYAALKVYEQTKGQEASRALWNRYRDELLRLRPDGSTWESAGPLDLGMRLQVANGLEAWRLITYNKGTWVIHMLAERLGSRANEALKAFATENRGALFSNETLRLTAARFLPKGDRDPALETFFDSWVYGTGIPALSLHRVNARDFALKMSKVGPDFSALVPIHVSSRGGPRTTQWVEASGSETTFQVPGSGATAALPDPSEFLYQPEMP